jgi:hypothetical protein
MGKLIGERLTEGRSRTVELLFELAGFWVGGLLEEEEGAADEK